MYCDNSSFAQGLASYRITSADAELPHNSCIESLKLVHNKSTIPLHTVRFIGGDACIQTGKMPTSSMSDMCLQLLVFEKMRIYSIVYGTKFKLRAGICP